MSESVSTANHPGESHPVLPGAEAQVWAGTNGHGVLVLHGFTGSPHSMRGVAQVLADAGFTVELPRLPGHGTAVEDMLLTGWNDWLAEAQRAYDSLAARVDRVAVVGLSMGATLAAAITVANPSVVGIAVINGALEPMDPAVAQAVKDAVDAGQTLWPSIGSDIALEGSTELSYDATPVPSLLTLAEAGGALAARLGEITCPALVMCSPQDHVVPPSASKYFADHVSGPVTWVDLVDSFHVATLDHDRALVESSVRDFAVKVCGAA
jgi:carboxylesterase